MKLKKGYLNDYSMNLRKAKNTIELLSGQWMIPNPDIFIGIIEKLWISYESAIKSNTQNFEFSFIEGENKIRLNHLFFLDLQEKDKIRQEKLKDRIVGIFLVVNEIEKRFEVKFNKSILKKLLLFARENKDFSLQFGLEYDIRVKPRVKIYFSINAKDFPLRHFCRLVNFDFETLDSVFLTSKFDTVAVDFFPDETFSLKLYPLISPNDGLLMRFSDKNGIISKKVWRRFQGGLDVENFRKINFPIIPVFLQKYIIKNKMKIFYFCTENNKKSFYFR